MTRRVLVGGVGYHHLSDYSLGPRVVARLQAESWPPEVDLRDLSFGQLAFVQEQLAQEGVYRRVVLVGAQARGGPPGAVRCYAWSFRLPPPLEIQARIAEAYTGIISLENLLVIGTHFAIWPPDVRVVEVEPAWETFGEALSPPVAAALPAVVEAVRQAALTGWSA